jgi:hypothetical protein
MATKETTYILKHSPEGLKLFKDRDADQPYAEFGVSPVPDASILTPPRWKHWYQRKLARPWQATLLGMNVEPVSNARMALKAHAPEKYRVFKDRLDILKTLLGYEIEYLDDHVREGDGADGKYVELVEYCRYAESIGWEGLDSMREGLMLDQKPPVLQITQRQTNNVLRVLDLTFRNCVPNYFDGKGQRSATAVLKWFESQETEVGVSDKTISNWVAQCAAFGKE